MLKILATLLSVVLVSLLALSGTVAYLIDTDSNTNTFTMGQVDIIQHEQERSDGGTLDDFVDRPLYPMIGEADESDTITVDGVAYPALSNPNVRDKIVTVENSGKTRAFVRTIIAFEANKEKIIPVLNKTDWLWYEDAIEDVVIGDAAYDIYVAYYNDILLPETTTEPTLLQVGMHHLADNEYVSQFGESYKVLVASQAVQCEGFIAENVTTASHEQIKSALDEAFGPLSKTNLPFSGLSTVAVTANETDPVDEPVVNPGADPESGSNMQQNADEETLPEGKPTDTEPSDPAAVP